jgi:hypothetical protein
LGALFLLFSIITLVGLIVESSQRSKDAIYFLFLFIIFALWGFILTGITTSLIVNKSSNIYYKTSDIQRYENPTAIVVTYPIYYGIQKEENKEEQSFSYSKSEINSIVFNDESDDKTRLMMTLPDTNIVISVRYGKNIFGRTVFNVESIECKIDKEINQIKLEDIKKRQL